MMTVITIISDARVLRIGPGSLSQSAIMRLIVTQIRFVTID